MEKILVLSDIHSGLWRAKKAVEMHRECKTVIFLGDGSRHIDTLKGLNPDAAFFAVRGNCDTFLDGDFENEGVLDIASHRIFICHGHTRFVKSGRGGLLGAAKEYNCDIALFGHTHHPAEDYDPQNGVYFFNPGSIGDARSGRYTYGLLSLDEKNVLFSVGEVE